MYLGRVTITKDNVFDLMESGQLLQIEDGLMEACSNAMGSMTDTEDIYVLLKIWNLVEQFGLAKLKAKLLKSMENRLESFLKDDILMYLGFEEIQEVLSKDRLCITSEKVLFDQLVRWMQHKLEDEEDRDIAVRFFYFMQLYLMPKVYVQQSLSNSLKHLYTDEWFQGTIAPIFKQKFDRQCDSCHYLVPFVPSRTNRMSDYPIEVFMRNQKHESSFASFTPRDQLNDVWSTVPSLAAGKTYYQHYGPHYIRDFSLAVSPSVLLTVGGQDEENLISHQVKRFEFESSTWQRYSKVLPLSLRDAQVVYAHGHFYVFGGHTESVGFSSVHLTKCKRSGVYISQEVLRIKEDELSEFSSRTGWVKLQHMPSPRENFTVAFVNELFFVIGDRFCDIFNPRSNEWEKGPPAIQRIEGQAFSTVLGSYIYVFGNKATASPFNTIQRLEVTTMQWEPLSPLEYRQRVTGAFTHNNKVYLLGFQTEVQNVVHEFDPFTQKWIVLTRDLQGTLGTGVLVPKSWWKVEGGRTLDSTCARAYLR